MERGKGLRSRTELWAYRKLRPLVVGREERLLPAVPSAALAEDSRPGLARFRRVAAGAVLVASVGAGGAWFGYGMGHDAGELEAAGGLPLDRGGLPGWAEDVCSYEASRTSFEGCRSEVMRDAVSWVAERRAAVGAFDRSSGRDDTRSGDGQEGRRGPDRIADEEGGGAWQ